MSTFAYRNARRDRLDDALAALTDDLEALRADLEQERSAIASDSWRVTDRAYLAVAADWLAAFPPEMSMPTLINKDPVLIALGIESSLTDVHGEAISFIPTPGDQPSPDFLDLVRAAIDNDESIFTDLVCAAHRTWILRVSDQFPHPFDDVGIMLPVRLETLFDPPDTQFNENDSRWQLSIRVVPDEVAKVKDSRYLRKAEESALHAFWSAVQQPGNVTETWLDGDAATIAWNRLAEKVGVERAAFLVGFFLPEFIDGSVTLPGATDLPDSEPSQRFGGLPAELWIAATYTEDVPAGTDPIIGRLPKGDFSQIDPEQLILDLPRNLEEARKSWWVDWDTAVNAGLAGEFPLAEGVEPQHIETLFVYGIGSEDPANHFAAMVEGGDFTVVSPGEPTNSVNGAATAGGRTDSIAWKAVAQRRLRETIDPEAVDPTPSAPAIAIRHHLFGSNAGIPAFPPLKAMEDWEISQKFATALWPALWGRYLRDIWKLGNDANWVGLWAMQNLWPEGPLLPILVGDEPYGLLPVTALSKWEVEFVPDPELERSFEVERIMASGLSKLTEMVARLTRNGGNVVGQPSAAFMQTLGKNGQTNQYGTREFTAQDARWAPFGLSADDRLAAREAVRKFFGISQELVPSGLEPPDFLIDGEWHSIDLSLVEPTRLMMQLREGRELRHLPLIEFLELIDNLHISEDPLCYDLVSVFSPHAGCLDSQVQPRVLPDSLLIRLLVYACQLREVWQHNPLNTPQEALLLDIQRDLAREIFARFDDVAWHRPDVDPDTGQLFVGIDIPDETLATFERAFRATLDTAAHRLDPWVIGFAWQRLQRYAQSPRRLHRMGIYGWVDGPFDGSPGPTNAGLLHTPSYSQTLAALVLRDKYLSFNRSADLNEAGSNPWQMDITASKVRLAEEIAEEVRMGFHLYEVVGRKVEQIVQSHEKIRLLRRHPAYAMRSERCDPNEVCNGLDVIPGLLAAIPPVEVSETQKAALRLLQESLNTYADLLVADGVMQLVNRQTDRAAETMDAAAGFSRPPSFEFIRTPPSGYQLETAVISALPFVSVDDPTVGTHPIRIADPSVAAAAEALIGHDWTWAIRDRANQQVIDTVTLDDLELAPVDTVGLPAQLLSDFALKHLQTDGAIVESPREHTLLQELIASFGERPVVARDIVKDQIEHPGIDNEIAAELQTRQTRLRQACVQMIAELHSAATTAAQVSALRRALAWGVLPVSVPEDRDALIAAIAGQPPPEGSTSLAGLCSQAAISLQKLHDDAVDPAPTIPELARWLATFASPNARLSVLGRWTPAALRQHSGIDDQQVQADLDEAWLTVVAATRAPLARLEALQLEMETPLSAWTSSPGDPWRTGPTNIVARNLQRRKDGRATDIETPRFAVAYGLNTSWQSSAVAAGLIDAFSEAVPMPQRETSAAFGFNAPSSRPPQAILLAVPPVPRQELTDDSILEIIRETRSLALARAGHLEQWNGVQAILPTSWLQSVGPPRVRLEPWPLFV